MCSIDFSVLFSRFLKIICLIYTSVYIRRGQWHPTPVLLPGKSHGRRSLGGCSPWGREESDTTERLHFPFSLSCTGEGNGSPLQCFCLENPSDGRAWQATVYGVTQSWTRLKQLSSSSNQKHCSQGVPVILSFKGFGEGNGIPLQYSCLEIPMDRGAW